MLTFREHEPKPIIKKYKNAVYEAIEKKLIQTQFKDEIQDNLNKDQIQLFDVHKYFNFYLTKLLNFKKIYY